MERHCSSGWSLWRARLRCKSNGHLLHAVGKANTTTKQHNLLFYSTANQLACRQVASALKQQRHFSWNVHFRTDQLVGLNDDTCWPSFSTYQQVDWNLDHTQARRCAREDSISSLIYQSWLARMLLVSLVTTNSATTTRWPNELTTKGRKSSARFQAH